MNKQSWTARGIAILAAAASGIAVLAVAASGSLNLALAGDREPPVHYIEFLNDFTPSAAVVKGRSPVACPFI